MRSRLESMPTSALFALAAGFVLVYALVLWLLVVSPKRSESAKLAQRVLAAELRLAEARGTSNRPPRAGVPVVDVLRLAKAMPSSADHASLVLELDRLGARTGVTVGSISVQEPVTDVVGATYVPVGVTVEGSYGEVTRFLRSLRKLVTVRRGEVLATGRLFTVQGVELAESKTRLFPRLDATITLRAYAYDGPIAPPTPVTPVPDGNDTAGTSALGATP